MRDRILIIDAASVLATALTMQGMDPGVPGSGIVVIDKPERIPVTGGSIFTYRDMEPTAARRSRFKDWEQRERPRKRPKRR